MSFHDFAGSTVVHTIGGWIALAGAIALGPRSGEVQARRRRPDAAARPHHRDRRRLILWFGWYGFNPGQHALGDGLRGHRPRRDQHHAGGCAAGLAAMFYAFPKTKTWDVSFTVQRFPRRLVAITCPLLLGLAGPVAILLGSQSPVSIVVLGVDVLECVARRRPDREPCRSTALRDWGTLSLGFFAPPCRSVRRTGSHRRRQRGRRSPASSYARGLHAPDRPARRQLRSGGGGGSPPRPFTVRWPA
jgi:Amt family ammonium transporter